MSAEDKGKVMLSLVHEIKVNRAPKPGSNKFDPDRLNFVTKREVVLKLVHGVQRWSL